MTTPREECNRWGGLGSNGRLVSSKQGLMILNAVDEFMQKRGWGAICSHRHRPAYRLLTIGESSLAVHHWTAHQRCRLDQRSRPEPLECQPKSEKEH